MESYVLWITRFLDDEGLPMGFFKLTPLRRAELRLPWLQGVSFGDRELGTIALRVADDDEDAGFFSDYVPGDVPLVTARLRSALAAAGCGNLEYFPVNVANAEDFDNVPAYWAINVVGCVAVADAARSRGSKAFGIDGATLFDSFQPAVGLEHAPPCFRSRESASTLVVSDAVRSACSAAGIDTLSFVPLDEWFA